MKLLFGVLAVNIPVDALDLLLENSILLVWIRAVLHLLEDPLGLWSLESAHALRHGHQLYVIIIALCRFVGIERRCLVVKVGSATTSVHKGGCVRLVDYQWIASCRNNRDRSRNDRCSLTCSSVSIELPRIIASPQVLGLVKAILLVARLVNHFKFGTPLPPRLLH